MWNQLLLQQGACYILDYRNSHDTQRIILYYLSTFNIAMVSDQYWFYIYLRDCLEKCT